MSIEPFPQIHSSRIADLEEASYDTRFKDLLGISQTNTIFDILHEERGLLKKITSIFRSEQQERNDVQNLVSRKIRRWVDLLTNAAFDTIYDPDKLSSLQKTIRKINSKAIITRIRQQILDKRNVLNEDINHELTTLSTLLIRILSLQPAIPGSYHHERTPFQSNADLPLPALSSSSLPAIAPSFTSMPLLPCPRGRVDLGSPSRKSLSSSTFEQAQEELQEKYEEAKRQFQLECKIAEMLLYTPKFCEDWFSKLLSGFKSLETIDEIIMFAEKIKPAQAVNLIDWLRHQPEQNWKVIYLLGSLKNETFRSVIQALDPMHLEHLNHILVTKNEDIRKWFIEAFEKQQKPHFRSACNALKDKIDAICGNFHNGIDRNDLSRTLIQEIHNLTDRALLDEEIVKKMPFLLKNINIPPATRILFNRDLIHEHHNHVMRLTTKFPEPEAPPGCVWPLVYLTAFCSRESCSSSEQEMFTDTDTVDMIFGDWSIFYAKDYREIGLFANIPDEDLQSTRINGSSLYPNSLAYGILRFLGISTVENLKKLEIFNRSMLEQYLHRPDIRAKIEGELQRLISASN